MTLRFYTEDTRYVRKNGYLISSMSLIDPTSYDREEVGKMTRITLDDKAGKPIQATQIDAFQEEICLMANGLEDFELDTQAPQIEGYIGEDWVFLQGKKGESMLYRPLPYEKHPQHRHDGGIIICLIVSSEDFLHPENGFDENLKAIAFVMGNNRTPLEITLANIELVEPPKEDEGYQQEAGTNRGEVNVMDPDSYKLAP